MEKSHSSRLNERIWYEPREKFTTTFKNLTLETYISELFIRFENFFITVKLETRAKIKKQSKTYIIAPTNKTPAYIRNVIPSKI